MVKYFAVLAVHLTKAVCAYVACRLDEYAERALIDDEGREGALLESLDCLARSHVHAYVLVHACSSLEKNKDNVINVSV